MSESPTPTAGLGAPIQRPPTAETESSSTTTSSSSTRTGRATHTFSVAPKQSPHGYVPHSVEANVGDEIVFEFYPTNHSVVRADFDAPCVPANHDVFFSGHFKITSYTKPEIWTWTVDTEEPIFFYCSGIGSCMTNGMVGAINPNETMTWEKQHNKAKRAPFQLEPGEHPPPEGGEPGSSPNPPQDSSSHRSLSGGAIAGIVVGAVVGLAILGALFYLLGRLEIYRKWRQSEDGTSVDRTRRWALSSGGGLGGWSSGAKSEAGGVPPSEMGGTVVSSQGGHMSYISAENTPLNKHLSAGFSPSSSPPPWGWDKQGGGNINGVMESNNKPAGIPENAPQELSGEGAGNLVELDAGPCYPPPCVSPITNATQ
ncbi:extracellular serine-rich protein [Blastomyces dermatitidis ATCC 18188]|uniref:Extracellular serine-rich protein n=1 Tax=Ajellomyces dermatitidis (strain ATCC 18188 / CBS 674.68) TaxID=653446 RepID=F2TI63_AJEDA|nr:extracellular serine-rich protein [Blastomyces dermatitidis ATCC 18188]